MVGGKDLYKRLKKGDTVMTPEGPATVLQVFDNRVTTHQFGEPKARFWHPKYLKPWNRSR